ncbi:MAG: hypothetical protein HQL69_24090 [Magnetococcales bacterium]|nr:hypothetical protein [Magnetococcales bacterium]
MSSKVILLSILYLGFLIGVLKKVRRQDHLSANKFLFLDGRVGPWLSFFGISATLFSTFTLMGMPAFFRNHGIAAWVFLGVTDVCLAGILLGGGLWLRKRASALDKAAPEKKSHYNITRLLSLSGTRRWVIWVYVFSNTLFLLPYLTIQIKGAATLFQSAVPVGGTPLFWSILFVFVLFLYSAFGGIRAIYLTDTVQGIVLFAVVYIVSGYILNETQGIYGLFAQINEKRPDLLTPPGPSGLLGVQFLLLSFISICAMPFVQPQLATRVLLVDKHTNFVRTTMGLGVFAFLVILPTMVIGLYGSSFSGQGPSGFLPELLTETVPPWVHAAFVVGVMAAAMSTTDSQLMAIGTEWSSALNKTHDNSMYISKTTVKWVSFILAMLALVLAQTDFRSLVLFAINSFIGTSLLLPIILTAILQTRGAIFAQTLAAGSIILFAAKLFQFLPKTWWFDLRMELWLYMISWGTSLALILFNWKFKKSLAAD